MWSEDIQMTIYSTSFHLILGTAVYISNNQKFGLVCIYGDTYHRQTSVT
jgi:hypothetical protein